MLTQEPSPAVNHSHCFSAILVRAEWLGFLLIFSPQLPQLREHPGAQISYEKGIFFSVCVFFYQQVEGVQSEWFTAAAGGGVCSGDSSTHRDSIPLLHSSQRQWR